MDDQQEVNLVLDSTLVQQEIMVNGRTRVLIAELDVSHDSVYLHEDELLPVACALIRAQIFAWKRRNR